MARSRLHRWLRRGAIALAALFGAIQLVPYGWSHPNPPVTQDAPWPSQEAAAIARDACYDCHSNETNWPVYAYVAPMSWLLRSDVESGRDELNFSTWDDDNDADKGAEAIEDGEMPPSRYTMLHPDAKLSDEEKQALIDALNTIDEND